VVGQLSDHLGAAADDHPVELVVSRIVEAVAHRQWSSSSANKNAPGLAQGVSALALLDAFPITLTY
jgi:hypothetical protein